MYKIIIYLTFIIFIFSCKQENEKINAAAIQEQDYLKPTIPTRIILYQKEYDSDYLLENRINKVFDIREKKILSSFQNQLIMNRVEQYYNVQNGNSMTIYYGADYSEKYFVNITDSTIFVFDTDRQSYSKISSQVWLNLMDTSSELNILRYDSLDLHLSRKIYNYAINNKVLINRSNNHWVQYNGYFLLEIKRKDIKISEDKIIAEILNKYSKSKVFIERKNKGSNSDCLGCQVTYSLNLLIHCNENTFVNFNFEGEKGKYKEHQSTVIIYANDREKEKIERLIIEKKPLK